MVKTDSVKRCFVIAPIGEVLSETRSRSDKVLRHIIAPAAVDCGYDVVRSDKESQPGMIGSQVINHLIEDELVIADLTDHNPNVFYELAIRHVVRKPIVQIIQAGQRLPFDVIQSRTIFVDHTDLDSAAECRDQLVRQIRAAENDPADVDNPITQAVKLRALDQSDDPNDRSDAQIIKLLQELLSRVRSADELRMPDFDNPSQEDPIIVYGGNMRIRDIRTTSQINNFLMKSEQYRELDDGSRKAVRDRCRELIKHIGSVSREELLSILDQFLRIEATTGEGSAP